MSLLRAATYNVHKCRGMDGRTLPARLARVIRELNVDLLAIQEVFESQAAYLAQETKTECVFGATRLHRELRYGNAVLSRWPVVRNQVHDLTTRAREPRSCLEVEVSDPRGCTLHFFAVHLGTSYFERKQQARRLLSGDVLDRPEVRGRRIIAGDFNEWTRGLATHMLSETLKSVEVRTHLGRGTTYPGAIPFLHLDHIYHDPGFHVRSLKLYRNATTVLASDHLPLVAEFEWS